MLFFILCDSEIINTCEKNTNTKRRRRRSTKNVILIAEDDEGDYDYDPPQVNITTQKTFPTKNGITELQAQQKCTKAITESSFGKACLKMFPTMNFTQYVDECVLDIQVIAQL